MHCITTPPIIFLISINFIIILIIIIIIIIIIIKIVIITNGILYLMFHYNQKLTNKNNYKIDRNDKNNRVSSNTVHKVRCSRNILQSVIKVKLLEQLYTLN